VNSFTKHLLKKGKDRKIVGWLVNLSRTEILDRTPCHILPHFENAKTLAILQIFHRLLSEAKEFGGHRSDMRPSYWCLFIIWFGFPLNIDIENIEVGLISTKKPRSGHSWFRFHFENANFHQLKWRSPAANATWEKAQPFIASAISPGCNFPKFHNTTAHYRDSSSRPVDVHLIFSWLRTNT